MQLCVNEASSPVNGNRACAIRQPQALAATHLVDADFGQVYAFQCGQAVRIPKGLSRAPKAGREKLGGRRLIRRGDWLAALVD